jgi:exosortase
MPADTGGERVATSHAMLRSPFRGWFSVVTILTAVVCFIALYAGILFELVQDWSSNDNYSHGFLVLPVALWLAIRQWPELRDTPRTPSILGLVVVAASLAVLLVGTVGVDLFLSRISMLGVLAGVVLFIGGWTHLRRLAFPLGLLILAIPLPAIVFNQIAFPLQLTASRLGVEALRLADIPVLREGNVIILATTSLEVAEACSGIRSLVSLITMATLYAYFADPRAIVRIAVALTAVPIAIITNGLRVAATGIAVHYYGASAATGLLHGFSGWLVFALSLLMLISLSAMFVKVAPRRATPLPAPATAVPS